MTQREERATCAVCGKLGTVRPGWDEKSGSIRFFWPFDSADNALFCDPCIAAWFRYETAVRRKVSIDDMVRWIARHVRAAVPR